MLHKLAHSLHIAAERVQKNIKLENRAFSQQSGFHQLCARMVQCQPEKELSRAAEIKQV